VTALRDARPDDHPAIDRLVADAFGADRPEVLRLVAALRAVLPARPGLELVAEEDGAVVGHAMWSVAWIDAPERLVEAQVLSPLSVAPRRQRTGIGSALVEAGTERLSARGASAVLLEGDPAYYARFGFEGAEGLGVLRPSVRIPEVAFQIRTLRAFEPWMRGALVYPDAFWQTDTVGLR
jgi:putative acetyltransferase